MAPPSHPAAHGVGPLGGRRAGGYWRHHQDHRRPRGPAHCSAPGCLRHRRRAEPPCRTLRLALRQLPSRRFFPHVHDHHHDHFRHHGLRDLASCPRETIGPSKERAAAGRPPQARGSATARAKATQSQQSYRLESRTQNVPSGCEHEPSLPFQPPVRRCTTRTTSTTRRQICSRGTT